MLRKTFRAASTRIENIEFSFYIRYSQFACLLGNGCDTDVICDGLCDTSRPGNMTLEPTWLPDGDMTLDRTLRTSGSAVPLGLAGETDDANRSPFSGQTKPIAGADTAVGWWWRAACIDKPFICERWDTSPLPLTLSELKYCCWLRSLADFKA